MSTETETPNAPTDPSADPSKTSDEETSTSDAPAAPEPTALEQAFTQLQGDFDTPSARLRLHGMQSDDPSDVHAVVLNEKGEPLASSGARLMLRSKARERGLTISADQGGGVLRVRVGAWPKDEDEKEAEKDATATSAPAATAEVPAKPAPKGNRRGS